MTSISFGCAVILIAIAGSISNWLNWRFLNYRLTRYLYYIGAFVHESSHAIACLLTGAKIREFTVFSSQPRVVHEKSKLPFIGGVIISSAPIFGGLLFLFLISHYALRGFFAPALPLVIACVRAMTNLFRRGPVS